MTADISQVTQDSARGGFFLFLGAASASIILAVSAILMGRFLGPELYGQYNLVLVIPSLLLLFTDLGINAGITKFVANLRAEGKYERVPAIIRHGMLSRIAIGVIVLVLSLIFATYFALLINRPEFTFYIQIASFSLIFQVILSTSNSAFVGLDKSEYCALTTIVRAVLTTMLQVALVFFSFSVAGALIGLVGGFVIAAILSSFILFIRLLKPTTRRNAMNPLYESGHQIFAYLARYGMPVYVSVVLIGFFPLYQQVILAFFSSDMAIGNFRAAYNFVSLLTVISSSLTTALLPAFSKLELAKPEVLNAFFNKANKYASLIIVPITFSVIIFSSPIVQFLYGPNYTSAPIFLSLSCSVYLLSIIGYLTLLSMFNGLGKTRITMNVTLVNLVILLALSPLLAAIYNVVGVILASLVSTVVATVYAAAVATRRFGIRFNFKPNLRIYVISVLSSFPPLILLMFTKLNFGSVLIAGGAMYLCTFITLMPLMKIVSASELETLMLVTKKLPFVKSFAEFIFIYQRKIVSSMNKFENLRSKTKS
jgi:O-antigen/teichoic acid export membrane protein